MHRAPYHLSLPEVWRSSVVFSSPHSGSDYSDAFMAVSVLDGRTIRSSEDAFVDLLFESATEFGSPFLKAAAPRAFVDLNRSADELDPALIKGARRNGHNPRVVSGLGVIPRVVANGRAIYSGKITMAEAEQRLSAYWRPYHAKLQGLLDDAHCEFGKAILIDCHSMPHEAIDSVAKSSGRRPEIVIGDRFGASASSEIVEAVEAAFVSAGLAVARNAPFAGAYVTQTYGRPSRGQHAIQIEIDRSLYMNEDRVQPSRQFDSFRDLLRGVIGEIAQIGRGRYPLAAE